MPRLVLPSVKYKKSFLEDFLKHSEMQDEHSLTGIPKKQVSKNFPSFIKKLKLQAKGIYPRKGLVPQTVYWLVDDNKFLGKLSIRHALNSHLRKIGGHIGYYIRPSERGKGYGKRILALGLQKAKKLGIKNILITCDITNLKSKKVIESNGGKLAPQVKQDKGLPDKLRYWIKI
ncbi:MAG: GNAT family N-acetyltransferase [Candidatus Doudnabacteria bacterium]|nr:GNAT family N-acetyltransferase [Candidatus Doudnabacteria bacterium]